jgi:RHH-type proline utilization regulon transcriptional repressor/proline dehydrogenase/delta 1-pyrroline-5-carboxylate dehydrogenase
MGETLYDKVVGEQNMGLACRIYAPVGTHETLLAYLVRRLLENGANSSFVNQIVDPDVPLDRLVEDPVTAAKPLGGSPHPRVPMPADLYPDRRNSRGIDLTNELALAELEAALNAAGNEAWRAGPMLGDAIERFDESAATPVASPADTGIVVGHVVEASADDVERALTLVQQARAWAATSAHKRAAILERAADLLEHDAARLIHLAVHEAGKTIPNAIGEVREAADFCRYYALRARDDALGAPLGAVACISPWNFPLAIFTGQVAAALAAGNAVLAKPAEQTTLIAAEAVRLLRAAGVPAPALQLLPGAGETVGARLIGDARVQGVVFTGSTEVAEIIHRTLAARGNVPLIAETGGQNAMIVDSSALPEQVVADVMSSAFDSAGQRCSALRVLFVQAEIAERVLEMLRGAMDELVVGNPAQLATDVGPIIDEPARRGLAEHVARMETSARLVARAPLASGSRGHFLAPVAFEIKSLGDLQREVFGPVLHVVRYRSDELARVVDDINASGYGLTLGIHSRLDSTIDFVVDRAHVGNIYVNRNVIGAVVGVQPFGGEQKSGTGPKAGGPLYLRALVRRTEAGSDAVRPGLTAGGEARAADLAAAQSVLAKARTNLHEIDRAAVFAALSRHADAAVATIAREYSKLVSEGSERELPGPTGERDSWRLEPRGLAVALGGQGDQAAIWLGQALAAVAAGDPVLLVPEFDAAAATRVAALVREAGWPAIAAASDRDGRWSALPELAAVIAGDAELAARATMLVAARTGARIPVVEPAGAPWSYPAWRLATERCVSVNTVAAGGNAFLLAQID